MARSAKDSDQVVGRFDGLKIHVGHLHIEEGYNIRIRDTPKYRERLEVLKNQIREKGRVTTPLRVRRVGDEFLIVEGHRRHEAVLELLAENAEIDYVLPCILDERHSNDIERDFGLVLSNSGEPPTQAEIAILIGRLLNKGVPRSEIMSRFGYKTAQSVANFELWLSLPHDVQRAVHDEEVAFSTAVEVARVAKGNDDVARDTLKQAREIANRSGRRRVTVRSVKPPRGNRSAASVEARNISLLEEWEAGLAERIDSLVDQLDEIQHKGADPSALAAFLSTRKRQTILNASEFLGCVGEAVGARIAANNELPRVV